MSLPTLIGLGGYATSGKDAVADVLVQDFGFRKTYMSKPLERALLVLNPTVRVEQDERRALPVKFDWRTSAMGGPWFKSYADLHAEVGYDASKTVADVRRLLQLLGTEVGREMFDKNVWVNLVFREVQHWRGLDGVPVVVTAIRFLNELHQINDAGGISVWVARPGIGPVNTHVSDNALGSRHFDFGFANTTSSLDDLSAAVREALPHWTRDE